MQINEVTIFKLIFFSICVVLITILVVKLSSYSSTNSCLALTIHTDVESSFVSQKCTDGYFPNYGKFSDVNKGDVCCVKYFDINGK